jgi:outer membrane protein OmpA-like peptidoglycan-associated protein
MHFKQTQIFEQQSAPKRRMRGLGILCGLIALMPIPVLAADEDEQTYTPPPLFGAAAPAEGSSRSKEVFIHVQKAAPIQSMRQAKVLPSSPQAKKEQKPQVIIIGSDNQGRAEIEDTGPRIMKFEVKSRKINLADEMNKEKEEAAKTNKAAKAAPAKKAKIISLTPGQSNQQMVRVKNMREKTPDSTDALAMPALPPAPVTRMNMPPPPPPSIETPALLEDSAKAADTPIPGTPAMNQALLDTKPVEGTDAIASDSSPMILGEPHILLPFNKASAVLTPELQGRIDDNIVNIMGKNPEKSLIIVGYALSTGHDPDQGKNLSLARALTVRDYLKSKGIAPDRMNIKARGNQSLRQNLDQVEVIFN